MTLHLIFSSAGWEACQPRMAEGDSAVLLGDGVYLANQALVPGIAAIEEDLKIRGVSDGGDAALIDYARMVELCTQHDLVVSWNN